MVATASWNALLKRCSVKSAQTVIIKPSTSITRCFSAAFSIAPIAPPPRGIPLPE